MSQPAINDILNIQGRLSNLFPEVRMDGDIGRVTLAAFNHAPSGGELMADLQRILARTTPGLVIDGERGPATLAALDHLDALGDAESVEEVKAEDADVLRSGIVKATSFADPADVRAFLKCKAAGGSDVRCFAKGDDGRGKWGADCANSKTPMVALPREVWRNAGKTGGAKVKVEYDGIVAVGELGDTMPSLENIKNGARIDLSPAMCKALGLKPPVDAQVSWDWA